MCGNANYSSIKFVALRVTYDVSVVRYGETHWKFSMAGSSFMWCGATHWGFQAAAGQVICSEMELEQM